MKDIERIKYYSPIEEKINIISHAIGLLHMQICTETFGILLVLAFSEQV
jgi:hypothetical protein